MAAPNPNAGIPWDQTPEYIALTDHIIPPGGQTTYTRFHPTGTSPTDFTAFVYGQRNVHIGNWPEVLYMLFPTTEWKAFKQLGPPLQKLDANQQAMFERWPRVGEQAKPLLDFPILPDSISSREELWRFDVWRKMDPRMSWDDLTMRIEVHGRTRRGDVKLQNSIQTMLGRFWHKHYHMISWFGKGKFNHNAVNNPARVQLLRDLANANPPIPLNLNTTKGLTPGSRNPAHGPNWLKVAWPNIRGGTIRGRPTRAAPAAAVISPVTPSAHLPAIASVATVTEIDGASDKDEIKEEEDEDKSEGTDAFIESNGGFSDVNDATASSLVTIRFFLRANTPRQHTAPAMSNKTGDENEESHLSMGAIADSEGEWSSTDSSGQQSVADSFDFGQSFHSNPPAIPVNTNTNGDTTDDPYATAFTPINHATPVPAHHEAPAAISSSQPPAKRRRIGSGNSNSDSLGSKGANGTDMTTSAEHIAPSYQSSFTPMPAIPPLRTTSPAYHLEPLRQSTGLPSSTAANNDSTSETNAFFKESGDLPPDGVFY